MEVPSWSRLPDGHHVLRPPAIPLSVSEHARASSLTASTLTAADSKPMPGVGPALALALARNGRPYSAGLTPSGGALGGPAAAPADDLGLLLLLAAGALGHEAHLHLAVDHLDEHRDRPDRA